MISGHTRVFAVVGQPVAHSLSPALHNRWLTGYTVDAVYVALAPSPDLDPRALLGCGIAGFNLTAPFKRRLYDAVDARTAAAEATGALNTVFREDGRWVGDNTDVAGFRAAVGAAPSGPVVVLGAGGSAAAVGLALRELGASDVTVLNRSLDAADRLARRTGATAAPLDAATFARLVPAAALVVNCTTPAATATLRGWCAALPVAPDRWFDLNYFDPVLPSSAAGGLRMLAGQAAAAFSRFTGIRLSAAEVDAALRAAVPRGSSA